MDSCYYRLITVPIPVVLSVKSKRPGRCCVELHCGTVLGSLKLLSLAITRLHRKLGPNSSSKTFPWRNSTQHLPSLADNGRIAWRGFHCWNFGQSCSKPKGWWMWTHRSTAMSSLTSQMQSCCTVVIHSIYHCTFLDQLIDQIWMAC